MENLAFFEPKQTREYYFTIETNLSLIKSEEWKKNLVYFQDTKINCEPITGVSFCNRSCGSTEVGNLMNQKNKPDTSVQSEQQKIV